MFLHTQYIGITSSNLACANLKTSTDVLSSCKKKYEISLTRETYLLEVVIPADN